MSEVLSIEEGRKLLAGGKVPATGKVRHRESKLQQKCIEWFRLKYPDKILFAIPNGGRRGIIEAKIMKGEGVLAGVPDLFLAQTREVEFGKTMIVKPPYHGLFIEMKTDKGTASPVQKAMHTSLRNAGYKVEIARSFDEFEKIVQEYLK